MNTKIKDIPKNDRPRERLISFGCKSLSNEELLAILLNSGHKEISAKNLASEILAKVGGIKNLDKLDYQNLINIKGIGSAKACTILAFNELVKRCKYENEVIVSKKFDNPKLIFDYYKDRVDWNQEQFFCLYLDSGNKIIKEKLLFLGTVNKSLVHPRDIFKEAFSVNASSIICVHNHPSDNLTPSVEDINLTNRIKEISRLMGITFLDHIIVGKTNFYSFFENGKI